MNTTIESLQALYLKNGGALTDTYSDIADGAAVGNYTTIPDMVAACAKLNIGGGGGAEKFIVTLTQENDTWTADKTIAEIVAADEANQVVVCKVVHESSAGLPPREIQLSVTLNNAVLFTGTAAEELDKPEFLVAVGLVDEGVTAWTVGTVELGSTNASLIVTLTAGSTEGQFVGDKTYKEAYDAYIAGQNVIFYAPSVNGMAEHVNAAENNTSADNPYALATKSFTSSGAASDYITITVGG